MENGKKLTGNNITQINPRMCFFKCKMSLNKDNKGTFKLANRMLLYYAGIYRMTLE